MFLAVTNAWESVTNLGASVDTPSRTSVGINRCSMSSTRRRVLALYKELHRLGRDYPDPKYTFPLKLCCLREAHRPALAHSYDFNGRMRRMFESVSHHLISNGIAH